MILSVTPNPCVDKTIFVDSIEAGTFIRAPRYACVAGGKGTNVARAVRTLGRKSMALVVVGGHTGAHVVDMIRNDDGVRCVPAWVVSPTRTITTVLEEGIHRQTAFFEPGSSVTPTEYGEIVEVFQEAVQQAFVVTLNGTVSDPSIARLHAELIAVAKAAGKPVLLDAHGPEFQLGIVAGPDAIKPNVAEAEEYLREKLDSMEDYWRAVDRFHELGIRLVVLSLGKDGALFSDGKMQLHAQPPSIEEVNPVGSGDALVAGIAVGMLENLSLDTMAPLAVAAGTANASSWDIGHFSLGEVNGILKHVQLTPR